MSQKLPFWPVISEAGRTSRKKVPLGIRLKSARRSHMRGFPHVTPHRGENHKLRRGCVCVFYGGACACATARPRCGGAETVSCCEILLHESDTNTWLLWLLSFVLGMQCNRAVRTRLFFAIDSSSRSRVPRTSGIPSLFPAFLEPLSCALPTSHRRKFEGSSPRLQLASLGER